ncbi:S8 family serine peptidase [Actinoplanes subtropicus]|uniref:S8 family serine peptidase n=1 Tax=Actinoplanes subtropicus TaxID=543632 RepID=UPI0006922458|nr:S8 family serine peptidase [Actinoplanes subtropicus]
MNLRRSLRGSSQAGGTGWRMMVAGVTAAVVAAGALPDMATAAPAGPLGGGREVVVTGSSAAAAADAVQAAGGRVLASLPVTNGVAAWLPEAARLGPEWIVAPQRPAKVAGTSDASAAPASTIRQTLGLPAKGNEGAGVTIAVIDTGVADVPDLAGRITAHVDLTGTGNGDGFGHGTFMAGLIAASGAASGGAYRGVAPAANIVDVKVADAAGHTDLVTMLRGLQWVSDHAKDIQVISLSLSSGSPLPYQVDPLNEALRGLWQRGVTVVVPTGNDGPGAGTVTAPGNDPMLLSVGGLDEGGTAVHGDDVVGTWSGRGPTSQGIAKPDLVAPGGHVVSLRSPGSAVDTGYPSARVGTDYFRGSGTSMATAVTAGIVADTLAAQPKLSPDTVKDLFVGTTYQAPGLSQAAGGGAGGLDAKSVLAMAGSWKTSKVAKQNAADATAVGGDAKKWAAFEQSVLAGDAQAAEKQWQQLSSASKDWAARAWASLDPAARAWANTDWAARAWAGASSDWAARAWAARAWAARAWADADWAARAWADADWAARAWAARAWAGDDWAARAWAADDWAARSWAWLPQS